MSRSTARSWLALTVLAVAASSVWAQLPRYPAHHTHACLPPNNGFPFCDATLAIPDRVADLISRMSLAEKIANRYDLEQAGTELGLPSYNWNQEGLHGLGAQCFQANATTPARCPTIFAAPPALAASWNATLLFEIGNAIGIEARAYNNFGGNRGYQNRPVDLNVWLPNLNIARDPRWGRQVETYAEDPWMTGVLGAAIVNGTQRGKDAGRANGYLQMIVAAKHATAYQVESNRFGINENISLHDLAETFYPAWEGVVVDGQAAGFMCAYDAINGVPCCGSDFLVTQLMRNTWGLGLPFQGGSYVQSDCGAIEDISNAHHYVANQTIGVAVALNAGVDVDCGGGYSDQLAAAIANGYTTESVLDASLTRTYTLQMLAGRFDPLDRQPLTTIPFEAIDSPEHQALALESALQGMVLLRNDKSLLPLAPGQHVALLGPHGMSQGDLLGNYFEQRCVGGTFLCVSTLLHGITTYNGPTGTIVFKPGCPVTGPAAPGEIDSAVTAAQAADVVILALGTNDQVAQEGSDAPTMTLPGDQAKLAAAVLAVGRPTVVLLLNGGTLSIDDIVNFHAASGAPTAIVEAFFPGEAGGNALAMQLFGVTNRWGKLPATVYPSHYQDQLPITQMSMTAAPGRTYKYYTGTPLYPFGFGLSYTTFSLSGTCPNNPPNFTTTVEHDHLTSMLSTIHRSSSGAVTAIYPTRRETAAPSPSSSPFINSTTASPSSSSFSSSVPLHCVVTVHNTGTRDGDEIVQVFVVPNASSIQTPDPLAQRWLVGFQRVFVAAGQAVDVSFDIDITAFSSIDDGGNRMLWSGEYEVVFTTQGEMTEVAASGREDAIAIRQHVRLNAGPSGVLLRRYGQ